jgi:hypothetical protein
MLAGHYHSYEPEFSLHCSFLTSGIVLPEHLSGKQNVGRWLTCAHGPGYFHDLAIADFSDFHMYLLQPFEHV